MKHIHKIITYLLINPYTIVMLVILGIFMYMKWTW